LDFLDLGKRREILSFSICSYSFILVDKKRRSLKEPEDTLEIKDLNNSLMEKIKDELRASLSNKTLADAVCAKLSR
jgi:hypothetical protein